LNRHDAESAKDTEEQKSLTAKIAKNAEEQKSFTTEGAKVAKDYLYQLERTASAVPEPPTFLCATLSGALACLGFAPIIIP